MAKIFRLAERRWVHMRAEHARSLRDHPAGNSRVKPTAGRRVQPPSDPTPNDAA